MPSTSAEARVPTPASAGAVLSLLQAPPRAAAAVGATPMLPDWSAGAAAPSCHEISFSSAEGAAPPVAVASVTHAATDLLSCLVGAAPSAPPRPDAALKRPRAAVPTLPVERSRRATAGVKAPRLLEELDAATVEPPMRPGKPAAVETLSSEPPGDLSTVTWGRGAWWFNWTASSPLDVPAIAGKLAQELGSMLLPPGWLGECSAAFEAADTRALVAHATLTDMSSTDQEEELRLRARLGALISASRATGTFGQYRNPFLKAVLWLAVRGKAISPPSSLDLALYLADLTLLRPNKSAAQSALNAVAYIVSLNGWANVTSAHICRVPSEAAQRIHGAPTKKAAPLALDIIARLFAQLVPRGVASLMVRPSHMRACGYVLGFAAANRYDDLTKTGYHLLEVEGDSVDAFYVERKNDKKKKGLLVSVAKSDSTVFGGVSAYAVLAKAKSAFGAGPILRRIKKQTHPVRGLVLSEPFFDAGGAPTADGSGDGTTMRYMSWDHYVKYLRQDLMSIGLSEEEASHFSAHSMRAGSTTEMNEQGVAPHLIEGRVGCAPGWNAGYDRVSRPRRLAVSLALGI